LNITAVSVSVIPYATVAAAAFAGSLMYTWTSLVGNGMKATTNRNPTLSIKNLRSARAI
jgi:hypothetical protein